MAVKYARGTSRAEPWASRTGSWSYANPANLQKDEELRARLSRLKSQLHEYQRQHQMFPRPPGTSRELLDADFDE